MPHCAGPRCHAILFLFVVGFCLAAMAPAWNSPAFADSSGRGKQKPLMRNFIGLNVHAAGFRPTLYQPVCHLVRDYHPVVWDLGSDTSSVPPYPASRDGIVNWADEYGGWEKDGYQIDACLQIEDIPTNKWKNLAQDSYNYGEETARFLGPSGQYKLATSLEIGNEPGNITDPNYRIMFENMAKGIRQGDPKMTIVTCNAVPGGADQYTKNLSAIEGLESLYDVINIHTYAFVQGWPTWKRSFPEDPTIKFLDPINRSIAWRNANAPGKQIWVTEFGWDSTTKPDLPTGDFSKWVGVTDTQQAEYIVRAFLVFSAMDIDRAYLYYFDDDDQPTLHASSGLTRHFTPKPSFYALAHLQKTLGDYRFSRVVEQDAGNVYAYEYVNGANKKLRVWAVWSPTGANRQADVDLPSPHGTIYRSEHMPLVAGPADPAVWKMTPDGKVHMTIDEAPSYLWIR